ncbi:MAG: hypothetical protein J5742_03770 [Alphaproteobacteria bacterium]|nr:hypothetical protein [Alphaproteobacteria bacterium]
MAKFNNFASENIGFSILGHLLVLGIIVFVTEVIIAAPEHFIAPDRIQITMIDLSQVRVSGDESVLYNTNLQNEPETVKPKDSEQEKKPDPVAADESKQPIESTTLISEEKPQEKPEPQEEKKDEKKPDETPAPKKKTVVRVNRNVVSLDRTLTVSVVDALRVAMTRCWNIDTTRSDISGLRVVAHLNMRKNGTVSDVWFESAARAETDPAFAYVLDTIRSAINTCQPLRMLPVNEYEKWQKIQLTFYPTQGKVI